MKSKMISLRPGVLADAGILAFTGGNIFSETYTGKMPEEDLVAYIATAFSVDKIAGELKDPENRFILAFYEGELAGYAKLCIGGDIPALLASGNPLLIDRMYVQQAFQGKKIGAALMANCLEHAVKEGFTDVWLAVWEKNPSAIRFYQRWGFELFDARIFQRGNDAQTGLLMKKNM